MARINTSRTHMALFFICRIYAGPFAFIHYCKEKVVVIAVINLTKVST